MKNGFLDSRLRFCNYSRRTNVYDWDRYGRLNTRQAKEVGNGIIKNEHQTYKNVESKLL